MFFNLDCLVHDGFDWTFRLFMRTARNGDQLYVAFSRAMNFDGVRVLVNDQDISSVTKILDRPL